MHMRLWILCLVCSLCCGFDFPWKKKTKPVTAQPPAVEMNAGYALLYDLLSDEKNVSKLLIIKKESSELENVIKAISKHSKEACEYLETIAKRDKSLNLQTSSLPPVEIQTRELISKTKGKQLLQAKGETLEFLLLLTQNEALSYGAHLATVIAAAEPDEKRKQFLDDLSRDLAALEERVLNMLLAHYKQINA
jgi:hypothetical protein